MMRLLFLLLSLSTAFSAYTQSTYEVDAGHSSLVFSINYNFSEFYGSFSDFSGQVLMEDDSDFSTAQISFDLNTASINTNNGNRDKHLQSKDYLNVADFAKAGFESKSIKKINDNNFEVTGVLTIAGISLSQTVTVEITGKGELGKGEDKYKVMGAKSEFSFNRSNFGIMAGIPGKSDKIDIIVSLQLVAQ